MLLLDDDELLLELEDLDEDDELEEELLELDDLELDDDELDELELEEELEKLPSNVTPESP